MEPYLGKVTAFIIRPAPGGLELLLFQHPNAGVQIPAGTVEDGETPEAAVVREVYEESGLRGLEVAALIGCRDDQLPENRRVLLRRTRVYARPDPTSFDWAEFNRGTPVTLEREMGGFAQVSYVEWDRFPEQNDVTYHILGWVAADALARQTRRCFFHLRAPAGLPDRWTHFGDNHHFAFFWARLDALPAIVFPQNEWLPYVREDLGYRFE